MKFSMMKYIYKYVVYYLVLLIRGEWIWIPRNRLEKTQYLSLPEIHKIQLDNLNRILVHAKSSKYYKDKIPSDRVSTLDDISLIPFLEKEDLRENAVDMETNRKPLLYTVKTSGGSTGAPVTLKKPSRAMANELAAAWRGCSWAGVDIGDMQARFWGVPMSGRMRMRSKLVDFVARRRRFSAFSFDQEDLDRYLEVLMDRKPEYFYGYTSMIYELSIAAIDKGFEGKINPKAIITTSEVLTHSMRETIQKAFNTKVFNEYGCGEVGTIAHECEYGQMHINMENVLVEIVDESGAALPEGSVGEIVVTDLRNDYMPLIRYRLRDFGAISKELCSCGRGLITLRDLKGRAYDFIENEKGKRFHGEFFLYIVEDLKKIGISVSAIQFIRRNSCLDILLSVKDVDYETASSYIKSKLKSEFSRDIDVNIFKVKGIDREPSGKLRVIKSEV